MAIIKIKPLLERLLNFVSPEPNTGCWLWTGCDNGHGYGRIGLGPAALGIALAHRALYELMRGPIPDGMTLDHLCRIRCCVNPDYLEAVTLQENIRRGECGKYQAARTHCPQGHEYTPENIRLYKNRRSCKACASHK
jgi:hypothetical protein